MSKLKFSPNLFLESQELNRFKKFLDDDGFRSFLLDNSVSFGFIKKPNEAFINGLASEGVGFTMNINEANLIDSNGNLAHSDAISQLAIPNDNNWYWIKIVQSYSSKEIGTYSIDSIGNLTCSSADGELLTILRGQPNYPSRVKFLNASNNLLEYDVEEVIDNNNAVLTGSFTAETGLTLSVVGTFTPGYVPLTSEKNIFQYDSSTVSLIQSNTTTEPAHTAGIEFFIARVKRNGGSILIEDKRNDIWTTSANYYVRHLDLVGNPLIGVEQVTFDDQFTPRDKNILEVTWGFRAVTYTVDLKNNKVTISAGSGGVFKDSNFSTLFTDGDFDGWRLYSEDGKYYNVQTSVLNAGTIELNFDNLEATSFFSDVNSSSPISQILLVVPEAEEIEIICTPNPDSSDSTPDAEHGLVETKKVFPINSMYGRIHLTVYHETAADFTITYKYKQLLSYGPILTIPNDSTGYYNENQFNVHGRRIGSSRTTYSNGIITLILNPKAYSFFQAKIDTGALFGVDTVTLTNANIPVFNLVVGANKQYQHFVGSTLTLSGDLSINLQSLDVNGDILKDGVSFLLHFEQGVDPNGANFRIVYDYDTTPVILKDFDLFDLDFVNTQEKGLFLQATWDKTNSKWLITSVPEVNSIRKTAVGGNITFVDSGATLASLVLSTDKDYTDVIAQYAVSFQSAGAGTNSITLNLYKNATLISSVVHTAPGATYYVNMSVMAMFNYVAGDVIEIKGFATTGFSATVVGGSNLIVSAINIK